MAQIAEVIKYEGDNSTFIWKHPSEDFNSLTQLIVHETQEAIFFMNGQALDSFGPGRYTLETQNIPKLGKILNRSTGDTSPFHCEVYFINKTEQMAIKWGTDSRVQYIEPTYGFPLSIGANEYTGCRQSQAVDQIGRHRTRIRPRTSHFIFSRRFDVACQDVHCAGDEDQCDQYF